MARIKARGSRNLPDDPGKFFRVSTQRVAEAQFLFRGGYNAASIYLAGYAIECGLKALILSTKPRREQRLLAESFRGAGWHHLDRLINFYYAEGSGPRPPAKIARALSFVNDEWAVELRYIPGERTYREAALFLDSAILVLEWIKGRL